MLMNFLFYLFSFTLIFVIPSTECLLSNKPELLIVTVATEETDGFTRFMRSISMYNLNVKVLGMNSMWTGGNVLQFPGGGQKIQLLAKALEEYKNKDNLLILFSDSYDVVFTNGAIDIIDKFLKFKSNIVFSAEGYCWPDKSLAFKYPEVDKNEKRFLNSGAYIGYAPYIYKLVTHKAVKSTDDDQLYFTNIFLDLALRNKLSMQLDTRSELFQNLNGALDEVSLKFTTDTGYLYNVLTGTRPSLIHGNGPIKSDFDSLCNYLAHSWTPSRGCQHCNEGLINLGKEVTRDQYPVIMLSVFIEQPTPFLEEFFQRVLNLTYPKKKMDLLVHCGAEFHSQVSKSFATERASLSGYRSINLIKFGLNESAARETALKEAEKAKDVEFLVFVDSVVQLTRKDTLERVISMNRTVVAPLVARMGKLWSNFWGALSNDGFYARSDDYLDIVSGSKLGLWSVPYVTHVYAVARRAFSKLQGAYSQPADSETDTDVLFAHNIREQRLLMHVLNEKTNFGHLVDASNFSTKHLHNDLYEIMNNPHDWEYRYLHPLHAKVTSSEFEMHDFEQPCPDVFWAPLLSETFAKHLVEEMENFGKWSDGTNTDSRLEGGYENVPTRDIHMRQVGWEEHWLHFLRTYVYPIQVKVFEGYDEEPWARMNFVVRYKPDEQPFLRPHQDASSYTLNIALNRPKIDYEGGGCRFTRYNCSMLDSRVGWGALHPGRVTHHHEGLRVTAGTRYIFVTFINPS